MTTYRFNSHTLRGKKAVNCKDCGKRMTRQRTFEETHNPFNVNKDTGFVKTVPEIYESLRLKVANWEANTEGYQCQACEFPASA